MSCAIKITNSKDCQFHNVRMDGFDIGIDAEDSDGIYLNSVDFGRCTTGLRGRRLNNLHASSCSHGFIDSSQHFDSGGFSSTMYYALLYLHNVYSYNPLKVAE